MLTRLPLLYFVTSPIVPTDKITAERVNGKPHRPIIAKTKQQKKNAIIKSFLQFLFNDLLTGANYFFFSLLGKLDDARSLSEAIITREAHPALKLSPLYMIPVPKFTVLGFWLKRFVASQRTQQNPNPS